MVLVKTVMQLCSKMSAEPHYGIFAVVSVDLCVWNWLGAIHEVSDCREITDMSQSVNFLICLHSLNPSYTLLDFLLIS